MSTLPTPTPWQYVLESPAGDNYIRGPAEPHRRVHIAKMSGASSNPEVAADAALIVTAVNAHAALIEALTELHDGTIDLIDENPASSDKVACLFEAARAALALAGGDK